MLKRGDVLFFPLKKEKKKKADNDLSSPAKAPIPTGTCVSVFTTTIGIILLFSFLVVAVFSSMGSMLPTVQRTQIVVESLDLPRAAVGWPGPLGTGPSVAGVPASPSPLPTPENPDECYRPDPKSLDCIKPDPSNGRAWREPKPVNLSALPSLGRGGGFFPGRYVTGPIDLAVMYLSRAKLKNYHRRAALRKTFSLLDKSTYRVAYWWAMTPPEGAEDLKAILAENATYGDIAFSIPTLPDGELTNKVWFEMVYSRGLPRATCKWGK